MGVNPVLEIDGLVASAGSREVAFWSLSSGFESLASVEFSRYRFSRVNSTRFLEFGTKNG